MIIRPKYIRTQENLIIVFSGAKQHSDFMYLNPKSAGFISFGIDKEGNPCCYCYGESISLGLKSMEEEDTRMAMFQILGE